MRTERTEGNWVNNNVAKLEMGLVRFSWQLQAERRWEGSETEPTGHSGASVDGSGGVSSREGLSLVFP